MNDPLTNGVASGDTSVTAILMALVLGLFEFGKYFIGRITAVAKPPVTNFSERDREILITLSAHAKEQNNLLREILRALSSGVKG